MMAVMEGQVQGQRSLPPFTTKEIVIPIHGPVTIPLTLLGLSH